MLMVRPIVYTITGPASMFGAGITSKTFTSESVFDGYIRHVRQAGYVVTFSGPFAASISRPLL